MRSGDTRRAKYSRPAARASVPSPLRDPKPGYSDLRREWLSILVRQVPASLRAAPLPPIGSVFFVWAGDRRRDRDGVRAASKLVLDALVLAGVLVSDKVASVAGPFRDAFVDGAPAVSVELFACDTGASWFIEFAGRLPDANEMIEAARLEGARLERGAARWRR